MKILSFYAGMGISYRNRKIKLLFSISVMGISLLAGVMIYLLFRSHETIFYQASQHAGFGHALDSLRRRVFSLPDWVLYSLPDALWMFSFSLLFVMVWGFERTHEALGWIAIALCTGFLLEILQAVGWIPGQFDVLDLALLFPAALLPFLFTIKSTSS